ncbi:tetratricopeptide repeat protein [Bacillus glycinifermentans]|uniref:Tetratricopeptide repeat protein n=2 Tax=Bacillaceae TaxID=186817 RepID=A0AAJ4D4Z4_9BACI|nr:tetratricopeptide repeat protein [Bacillus glycinifermentans]NUJ19124.1 tetratricopeptide repeat protein [Bacillus glycinifermentans]QAT67842.1 tetratricopeptide repeat protein [Bacillus glycinifermentans]
MLNHWYTLIRQQNVDQAVAMKDEIEHTLPNMEEDQDLLIYFNLLDFRHKMMLENFNESKKVFKKLESQKKGIEKTDAVIQYYFYFFSGQNEFHNKNYIKAINYYQIAENKLKQIPDEIENAEFHYRLSIAYYYIKQNIFSLRHAETALETFRAHELYIKRKINCEMVLGANKIDLFRYNEAEAHYQKALEGAKKIEDHALTGKAYHNIGISYALRKIYNKAEENLKAAIAIPEHLSSSVGVNSISDLTRVLYKIGAKEEARHYLEQGNIMADEKQNDEYHAKLKIIEALYENEDLTIVDENIQYLESLKLWPDVEDFAQDVADYFRQKGEDSKTVIYLDKVIHAKNQIFKVTEELQ